MKKKEKDLRSQIKDLLAQAEAADAEEDAATPVPDPCDAPPRRRMIRRELNTPRNSRKPATSSSSEGRKAAVVFTQQLAGSRTADHAIQLGRIVGDTLIWLLFVVAV
jgi:hypothetical protein